MGIATASGVSPRRICGRVRSRGSRRGTTESSAFVYGCCGFPTTAAAPAFLDDAAEVHDGDPLGEAGRCGEVVRDHQDCEALLAQAIEDVEDTCADRDVEHRDRFVGYEQPRARGRALRRSRPADAGRRTARADTGRGRARAVRARHGRVHREPARLARTSSRRGGGSGAAPRPPRGRGTVGRATRTDLGRRPGSGGGVDAARVAPSGTRLRPSKRIDPETGSTSRSTAWAVVVLPQPDSPTRASISPRWSESETPSTACTLRRGWRVADPTRPRCDRVADDEVLDLEQRRFGAHGPTSVDL